MKYSFRISKYNPTNRNEKGHYLIDEWTSPSEIGKTFGASVFTVNDYLSIEQKYIDSIILFFKYSKLEYLRISSLEANKISLYYTNLIPKLKEDLPDLSVIKYNEDQVIRINELSILCKLILRNVLWCRLSFDDKFEVFFGEDFYVYISTIQSNYQSAINKVELLGLFCESYKNQPLTLTWSLEWSDIKDENKIILGSITIPNLNKQQIRKIFHLSNEHPADNHQKVSLQNSIDLKPYLPEIFYFDFDKYEYLLFVEQN